MPSFSNEFLKDFSKFISADCDRKNFIETYLKARGVETANIALGERNHIYVKFPTSCYNAQFRIKTIVAHYDRVENSPGANDNSAAVFCLMHTAQKLAAQFGTKFLFHNTRILFTDGEEIAAGGVQEQGAFALAKLFQKLNLTSDDVYVFDCMGRGTIPVIGKNDFLSRPPLDFQKRLNSLEERTQNILRASCKGRWLSLPLSYSDNAGFVACGIPAVAITMLPQNEADAYIKNLIKEKKLEAFVRRQESSLAFENSCEAVLLHRKFSAMLPETWQLLHTKYDSIESLTPESLALTEKILDEIALEKTPLAQ